MTGDRAQRQHVLWCHLYSQHGDGPIQQPKWGWVRAMDVADIERAEVHPEEHIVPVRLCCIGGKPCAATNYMRALPVAHVTALLSQMQC